MLDLWERGESAGRPGIRVLALEPSEWKEASQRTVSRARTGPSVEAAGEE